MSYTIPHSSINDDDRISNISKPSTKVNKKVHSPIFRPNGIIQMKKLDKVLHSHINKHKHYYGKFGIPTSLGIMSKMLSSPMGSKRFNGFTKEYEQELKKHIEPMMKKNIDDLSGEGLMDDAQNKYGEIKTNIKERYEKTKDKIKTHFEKHGDNYKKYGIPIATATALALAGAYAYTRQPNEMEEGFVGVDDAGDMFDIDTNRGAGDMSMINTPEGLFKITDGVKNKLKRKDLSKYLYADEDDETKRSILEEEDIARYIRNPNRTWETRLEKLSRINYEKERGLYDVRKLMDKETSQILDYGDLDTAKEVVEDSLGSAVYKSYTPQGQLTPYGRLREETQILKGLSSINKYAPSFLRRDDVNRAYSNRDTRRRGNELFAQYEEDGSFIPVRRTDEGFVWDIDGMNGRRSRAINNVSNIRDRYIPEINRGDDIPRTPSPPLEEDEGTIIPINSPIRPSQNRTVSFFNEPSQEDEGETIPISSPIRPNISLDVRDDVAQLNQQSDYDLARLDQLEQDSRRLVDEGEVLDLSQMRTIEQDQREELLLDIAETTTIPIAQMNQTEYEGMIDGNSMMPIGRPSQNIETEELRGMEEFMNRQASTNFTSIPLDDVRRQVATNPRLIDVMPYEERELLDIEEQNIATSRTIGDLKARLYDSNNFEERELLTQAIEQAEGEQNYRQFDLRNNFFSTMGQRSKNFGRRARSTAMLDVGRPSEIMTSIDGDRRVILKSKGENTTKRLSQKATELMGRPLKIGNFTKSKPLYERVKKQPPIGQAFAGNYPNPSETTIETNPRPPQTLPPITTKEIKPSFINRFFSKGGGSKGKSKGGSKGKR